MAVTGVKIKKFQEVLEGPLRKVLEERYPDYMKTYFRFRDKKGPACPFARGIVKNIFIREYELKKGEFLERLQNNNWEDYE